MVNFNGARYSQSIKRTVPCDRISYRCHHYDLRGCRGEIQFAVRRDGKCDFNEFLGYEAHSRSCQYSYTNNSLERLLKRTLERSAERPRRRQPPTEPEETRKKSKRLISISVDYREDYRSYSEESERKPREQDRKVSEQDRSSSAKSKEKEEERSETYELFKCMFDFESTLKALIKYSEEEANRPFLNAKIDDYQNNFERLLSRFRAGDLDPPASKPIYDHRSESDGKRPVDEWGTSVNGLTDRKVLSESWPPVEDLKPPSHIKLEPQHPSDSEVKQSSEVDPRLSSDTKVDLKPNHLVSIGESKCEKKGPFRFWGQQDVPATTDEKSDEKSKSSYEAEVLDDGRINLYG